MIPICAKAISRELEIGIEIPIMLGQRSYRRLGL
jgi:hypothetical protein